VIGDALDEVGIFEDQFLLRNLPGRDIDVPARLMAALLRV
jgi:hypothetical protein